MNAVTPFPSLREFGLCAVDELMLSDAGAFDGYERTDLIEGKVHAVHVVHWWQAKAVADLTIDLGCLPTSLSNGSRIDIASSMHFLDEPAPEPNRSTRRR
jgi:hypothetical protein